MTKEQVYKEGLQEASTQIDALIERYADDEVAGYLRQISAHIMGTFMEADGLSAEPSVTTRERETARSIAQSLRHVLAGRPLVKVCVTPDVAAQIVDLLDPSPLNRGSEVMSDFAERLEKELYRRYQECPPTVTPDTILLAVCNAVAAARMTPEKAAEALGCDLTNRDAQSREAPR